METIRRGRHRVEHAEVIPPDLLDDIADLGLVISAQPYFEVLWGGTERMYAARLGPERAAWTNPYRALADRGVYQGAVARIELGRREEALYWYNRALGDRPPDEVRQKARDYLRAPYLG